MPQDRETRLEARFLGLKMSALITDDYEDDANNRNDVIYQLYTSQLL